jgi:hypothetical protein
VAIRKDVLVVVRFQYNAAEQATWGPVIKLMDDPLRLGAGRQPAKDGFSTRSGLCRLSRNKKMSGYPGDRVASCALARCPVSAPRRCHEVVPWQTVAAFERPLWRNVAVRSGSMTVGYGRAGNTGAPSSTNEQPGKTDTKKPTRDGRLFLL